MLKERKLRKEVGAAAYRIADDFCVMPHVHLRRMFVVAAKVCGCLGKAVELLALKRHRLKLQTRGGICRGVDL